MSRVLCLLFHDVYRDQPSESGFSGAGADRYKLTVPQFETQVEAIARARPDPPALLDVSFAPPAAQIPFTLTVDDGGVSFYTEVADRLESRGWHAHCFVTTGCLGQQGFLDRRQLQELLGRGHAIGSHSVSHPERFSACSWDVMLREWRDSRQMLADLLGTDITAASVPGGYYSRRVAAAAREAGYRILFTSEPETRTRVVEGCTVVGRFTVRRGAPPGFSASLVKLRRSALWREWLAWRGKKLAKTIMGPAYPWLATRISA